MSKWIAVPICPDCDEVMTPDENGDYECPECGEIIENEDKDEF